MEKRDSRRHSTASFCENVVAAETSYQITSNKDNSAKFSFLKKKKVGKTLQIKSRTGSRSRPRILRSLMS